MWLEQKYLGLLSNRLERFKRTRNNTFNFRCPVCGDSQKSRFKARGWVFPKNKGSGMLYHCHNCNVTMDLEKLIEKVDPLIYKEFMHEKLSEHGLPKPKTELDLFTEKLKPPSFIKDSPLIKLKKISQLNHDHPVKKYVQERLIPNTYHAKLFYASKFKHFVNLCIPNKFENLDRDEPRLIIPFLDENKNMFGFQGRGFRKDGIRYITIMIDSTKPKIFGLDTCDRSKLHYILEGPIDSMFVTNSIAMAGGSIDWNYVNEYSVFVFDNEPRSKETCKKIEKIIDKGHKVVIFPEFIRSKDINDMIKYDQISDTNALLYDNISSGLEAKIIFTAWKKI